MKRLVVVAVLAGAPQLARADGWIRCTPDSPDHGHCNAGADSASVGSGLLLLGAVTYGIARRKRR